MWYQLKAKESTEEIYQCGQTNVFLCITSQQGAVGSGKECTIIINVCCCSSSYVFTCIRMCIWTHPLLQQFTYKQRTLPWKIQFLTPANHVPFLFMPTIALPSWFHSLICWFPVSQSEDERSRKICSEGRNDQFGYSFGSNFIINASLCTMTWCSALVLSGFCSVMISLHCEVTHTN